MPEAATHLASTPPVIDGAARFALARNLVRRRGLFASSHRKLAAALLVIVPKQGRSPTKEEILGYLDGKIAKWWMPDDVVFAKEIPHTATGKIQKVALRQQFKGYALPTARSAAE